MVKLKIPKQPEINIGTAGHVDHGKCILPSEVIYSRHGAIKGHDLLSKAFKHGHFIPINEYEGYIEGFRVSVPTFNLLTKRFYITNGIVYVQRYRGPIYVISDEVGGSLSATPNHPILTRDGKRLSWKKISQVNCNDEIVFTLFSINGSLSLDYCKVMDTKTITYDGIVIDLFIPETHNFLAGPTGIISHNTTMIQALTGIWTSSHSEELRRGITIKIGYADMPIYKLKRGSDVIYWPEPEYPGYSEPELMRVISFVDCPGHESLMANMLSGAAVMDGAILVIAANEPVPRPQTKEHAMALEILGIKDIVVVQNKIDLVSKEEAIKNYEQIKEFLATTKYYADAPIIPISAIQKVNLEYLVEAIQKYIPTPKRDFSKPARMLVIRSFNINLPGTHYKKLRGGVIGGSIIQGKVKVGDELEILPGYLYRKGDKVYHEPLYTEVLSLSTQKLRLEEAYSGGLIGIQTDLDPSLTRADGMVGNVAGKPGTLPEVRYDLSLDVTLFTYVVGTDEQIEVKPLTKGEPLRLNVGSATSLGIVVGLGKDWADIKVTRPVVADDGWKVAIARRFNGKWRLIGVGEVK